MSKRPCVPARIREYKTFRVPSVSCMICLLVLIAPSVILGTAAAQRVPPTGEEVIVGIALNSESKGDRIVYYVEDRDFLIKAEDLKETGFTDPGGAVYTISGEPWVSLRSMKDVTFTFDEKTLSLAITADPKLLVKRVLDFKPGRSTRVYYPKDNSAFLNYGFAHSSEPDNSSSGELSVTNELGVRVCDILFLTNSTYERSARNENLIRLQSNATYDFRKDMRRLVLGDFFASSGDLGGSVNLGGLSYSKVYGIDPYFIKQPLFNLSGQTTLPSEADIYVDGVLMRREKLSPGGFELRNIQYYGGYRNVDVVMRDPFGREQTIRSPFFFNDVLLRKGLHEYSYSIGSLRQDYGEKSNRYGNPAFSAFHRYGVSDTLALGLRGEGAGRTMNYGPVVTFLEKRLGIFKVSLSQSLGEYGGFAGLFSHLYQSNRFSTQFMLQGNTRDYRTLTNKAFTDIPKCQVSAGVGYSARGLGSLSLNYAGIRKYLGYDSETFTTTYQRQLTDTLQMSLSFRQSNRSEYGNELSLRLTYYPKRNIAMTVDHRRDSGTDTTSFQVQKNVPAGEGYGYRITAQETNGPEVQNVFVNPFVQLNGPHGIYTGEFRGQYGRNLTAQTYVLSASGGIVHLADTIGFTRPVYDSFGLVKVGGLKGVEILQNNQVVGKTDTSGKAFVPSMNSFTDNFIAVNYENLPMNHSIKDVVRSVSPPFRSGSLISFDVSRTQGIAGILMTMIDGSAKPVEFREIHMVVNGKEVTFPTGRGGEFYVENIPPGQYHAWCNHRGKTLVFDVAIPASDDIIIDLGSITIENIS